MLCSMTPPSWDEQSAREEEEYLRDFERESRLEEFFGSVESDQFGPSRFERLMTGRRGGGCILALLRGFINLALAMASIAAAWGA